MPVMEGYQIFLLILVLVSFFYVSVVVYVIGKILFFKRRLKRKVQGLNLLLYERTDTLLSTKEFLVKKGVALNAEDGELFEKLNGLSFQRPTEESIRDHAGVFKAAASKLQYLAQANHKATVDANYARFDGLLQDLERNYRTLIGAYNADVVAFNYWLSIPTMRWIGKMLRCKKRSSLS